MGCSPSKGKLFSKPQAPGPQNVEVAETVADQQPVEEGEGVLKTDENEPPKPTEEHVVKETECSQVASDTKPAQEDVKEVETNAIPQDTMDEVVQAGKVKKTEKRKKNKDKRRRSLGKQRKSSIIQTKVDFPPHMVRAHQAAYAFLNPNISKYETLLGLLDQAAQTQLSLRPMMTALVLRFEEINQALEEMADEGELMLKDHGDCMALPSGMLGPAVMPVKSSIDTPNPADPPPDLLQQLLQHSTEKMRLVGGSVQALGDTTLEDASEYFSSLSKVLVGKLRAKQAAERRLTQVLARVEAAAIRKSNPEDTALHSEDSGIGGENESLTGSERHRRHRGSAGSGSCGSGVNIRSALDSLPCLVGHNENDEDEEEEEDDDDDDNEEYEDDEEEGYGRKRSNSSPPDPSQTLLYLQAKYMQDAAKRPMTAVTAAKAGSSSSDRCVNLAVEFQKSQRDLDQRMRKMADIKGNRESAGPQYNFYRAGLRRHSLSGSGGGQTGSFKSHKSPGFLPMLAPQPPKRQSVRRLINTFSQGVDGRPGQSLANVLPHIRRPRKSGIHLLSDTGNDAVLVVNGNNNNNSWPDSKDDLDVDSLPPPPPEVLMDNSFHVTESLQGNDGREDSIRSLPMINQKTGVSQRLRTCVQNVDVLPNRVRPKSTHASTAQALKQNAGMGSQDAEEQPETDPDPEMEKANCLYQQAHKIIHLRNAAESTDKRNIAHQSSRGPSPLPGRLGHRSESSELYEGELSACNPPVTAPPVSRVRLPPSGPSIRKRYPSPPVVRPPSRPSSPRTVTRASVNDSVEIIPSVSFHDARSVFCQKESQNTQSWTPCGSSVLPRPWGETSRGRLSKRGPDSSGRRTQSEQRPSSYSEFPKDGNSLTNKANGGEPGTTKRLSGPVVTGGEDQSDASASVTTA